MTQEELERTMRLLEPVYDVVRIVDPSITQGSTLNSDGLLGLPHTCFDLLDKGRRCRNCISARTCAQKRSISKFEFVGDNAFYISTRYVEVDGKALSLELVKRINDDTLLPPVEVDDRAQDELQNLMERTEKERYADETTGALNRRYLEDGISSLRGSKVALLRIAGLDHIVAIRGPKARDLVLSAVSGSILSSIRAVDTLVHFETDSFLIIFEGIPRGIFSNRLESIRIQATLEISRLTGDEAASIVVGAVIREDMVSALVHDAEDALKKAEALGLPLVLIEDDKADLEGAGATAPAPTLGDNERSVDGLTGLPLTATFRTQLQERIEALGEGDDPLHVIHLDIENFKAYNRAYGLPEGDVLLSVFSNVVRDTFESDPLTRSGVDTFIVATQAADYLERIDELADKLKELRRDVTLELKCGIFEVTDSDVVATRAIDSAKIACNSIKGKYDRTIRAFDDNLQRHISMHDHIVKNLDAAINEGRIRPYYQAIVRAFTGKVSDMEALARWEDDTFGLISPADVIPTLEHAHLIHKHDTHIVRCVCRDLRLRLDEGKDVVPVSVNLSRLDFELCDIFSEIEDAVTTYDIDRSLIGIEVTESTLDKSNSVFRPQVERFRAAGYEIWMDDFGSGYSSLNLLKDYDFDVLKIDMAFIRGLEDNHNSKEILSTIVDMAKRIGIRTLAEGVETESQYAYLRNLGCEMIQGYLFAKPTPFEHLDTDIRIEIESAAEAAYLNSVGRVNLLSQQPAKAVNPKGSSLGLPLALIDYDGERFTFFTANEAYLRYLSTLGLRGVREAEDAINGGENTRHFRKMAAALVGTHDEVPVKYVAGGRSHYTMVQYVDKSASSCAFLISPKGEMELIA